MAETTPPPETDGNERGSGLPPPSWYAFVLTALLLSGAAIALAVADERTANPLAGLAYLSLAAGVVLRLAEYARLRERAVARVRRIRPHVDRALARSPAARRAIDATVDRARRAYRRALGRVRASSLLDAHVEDGIRLSIPVTIAVGAVIVGSWWLDPARTVSVPFLAGWALAVLVLVWLSVIVPELRRA